jgi:hypothetical protein
MSGMPPPPAPAPFGSGLSATIASVVINRPATDAASSSAVRTTFAGSMTPNLNMSPYSSVWALKPKLGSVDSTHLAGDDRAVDAGSSRRSGAAGPGARGGRS